MGVLSSSEESTEVSSHSQLWWVLSLYLLLFPRHPPTTKDLLNWLGGTSLTRASHHQRKLSRNPVTVSCCWSSLFPSSSPSPNNEVPIELTRGPLTRHHQRKLLRHPVKVGCDGLCLFLFPFLLAVPWQPFELTWGPFTNTGISFSSAETIEESSHSQLLLIWSVSLLLPPHRLLTTNCLLNWLWGPSPTQASRLHQWKPTKASSQSRLWLVLLGLSLLLYPHCPPDNLFNWLGALH